MFEVGVFSEIERLLGRSPFVKFDVVMADGRMIPIFTNEQAWLSEEGDLLYVVASGSPHEPETDILVLRHVQRIRVHERMKPSAGTSKFPGF